MTCMYISFLSFVNTLTTCQPLARLTWNRTWEWTIQDVTITGTFQPSAMATSMDGCPFSLMRDNMPPFFWLFIVVLSFKEKLGKYIIKAQVRNFSLILEFKSTPETPSICQIHWGMLQWLGNWWAWQSKICWNQGQQIESISDQNTLTWLGGMRRSC